MTIFVAAGVCLTAYGFLSAYALKAMRQEQLAAQRSQLLRLNMRKQELTRQEAILKQAAQFSQRARDLGLERTAWSFYDVNIQAPMGFEAAREIIQQCSDSHSAYFWPITLEVKASANDPAATTKATVRAEPADVQISIKGRFVAKR